MPSRVSYKVYPSDISASNKLHDSYNDNITNEADRKEDALTQYTQTIINDLKRSKKQLLLILLFSVLAFGVFYAISTLYDNHIQKFIIKLLNQLAGVGS